MALERFEIEDRQMDRPLRRGDPLAEPGDLGEGEHAAQTVVLGPALIDLHLVVGNDRNPGEQLDARVIRKAVLGVFEKLPAALRQFALFEGQCGSIDDSHMAIDRLAQRQQIMAGLAVEILLGRAAIVIARKTETGHRDTQPDEKHDQGRQVSNDEFLNPRPVDSGPPVGRPQFRDVGEPGCPRKLATRPRP